MNPTRPNANTTLPRTIADLVGESVDLKQWWDNFRELCPEIGNRAAAIEIIPPSEVRARLGQKVKHHQHLSICAPDGSWIWLDRVPSLPLLVNKILTQ